MKIFGIFEGGGAKGLAHVGALKALEERNIEFDGIAGTSAGAIIAALISVGYTANELFDKNDATEVYGINFLNFFDDSLWRKFQKFLANFKELLDSSCACEALINLGVIYFKDREIRKKIFKRRGIFTTAVFENYLNQSLLSKLNKGSNQLTGCVTFKDIEIPLKILATDVVNKKVIIFSKEICPDLEVAKAVAASINLPIIFEPYKISLSSFTQKPQSIKDTIELIDGGLLSNFPAWLFDDERTRLGAEIPTIGFRLVEKQDLTTKNDELSLKNYSLSVLRTVISGDPILETREIENLHEVPLRVSYGTLDFHMDEKSKSKLFNEGYESAVQALSSPQFPKEKSHIKSGLSKIREKFRDLYQIETEYDIRANIVIRTSQNTLRVMYTSGMDSTLDTDDNLMFPLGSGACGLAYEKATIVICNLNTAKEEFDTKWKMTKYQQALVRKDIKALVSHPVTVSNDDDTILGILNIDTNYDIYDELAADTDDLAILFEDFCNIVSDAFK